MKVLITGAAGFIGNALALRLLAGVIARDKRTPGDVRAAARYPVLPELTGKGQHHVLQVAYDTLEKRKQTLLSRFAAFRSPMDYEALLEADGRTQCLHCGTVFDAVTEQAEDDEASSDRPPPRR